MAVEVVRTESGIEALVFSRTSGTEEEKERDSPQSGSEKDNGMEVGGVEESRSRGV